MHATITMHEEDGPRASVIEDTGGLPFLVIGSPGSLGGLTVELTADLIGDLTKLVKDWEEEADAAGRADDGSVRHPRSCWVCGVGLPLHDSECPRAVSYNREAELLNPPMTAEDLFDRGYGR